MGLAALQNFTTVMCVCVCVCAHACAQVHICGGGGKSKDNLWALAPSFYHTSSGDWTQVVKSGDKGLYLTNHPVSPKFAFSWVIQSA